MSSSSDFSVSSIVLTICCLQLLSYLLFQMPFHLSNYQFLIPWHHKGKSILQMLLLQNTHP